MSFSLEIRPAARSGLESVGLTRQGRIGLYTSINSLRDIPDGFRLDLANRLGPFFVYYRVFADSGRLRQVRLIVDDQSATMGILRIVYADFAGTMN